MSGYTEQSWVDLPSEDTPIDADSLNHMEAGIAGAYAGPARRSFSTVSDILELTDVNNVVRSTGAAQATRIIPANAATVNGVPPVDFPAGSVVGLFDQGADGSLVAGAGSAIAIAEGDSASNGGTTGFVASGSRCKPFASGLSGTVVALIATDHVGTTGTHTAASAAGYGATWSYLENFYAGGVGFEIWVGAGATTDNTGIEFTLNSPHTEYVLEATLWSGTSLSVTGIAGASGTSVAPQLAAAPGGMGYGVVLGVQTLATSLTGSPPLPWADRNASAWSISNIGCAAAWQTTGAQVEAVYAQASAAWVMLGAIVASVPAVIVRSLGGLCHIPPNGFGSLWQQEVDDWVYSGAAI